MILTAHDQSTLTRVAEQMAVEMSEEQLLREIGLRARTFAMYPAAANCVERSVPEARALERAWDDLSEFGGWIYRRLHRQLSLAAPGEDPLRRGFDRADDADAAAVVSMLTATLGVAPAIASVVAALAIKRPAAADRTDIRARPAALATDVH